MNIEQKVSGVPLALQSLAKCNDHNMKKNTNLQVKSKDGGILSYQLVNDILSKSDWDGSVVSGPYGEVGCDKLTGVGCVVLANGYCEKK